MLTNSHSGRRSRRIVAAGALIVLLAGCSDKDQLSDVVVHAGNQMTAASGNGVSTPPTEMRVKAYNSVLSELREALRGHESEPGANAAKLLIAQALLGQGDVAAERAGDARRELLYQINHLRSRLDLQANRETLAHAYSNYDPSPDLKQLDASQQKIEKELSGLRATLADKQQRIETLQGQMDEQKKSAEERVAEASKIRAEATDASAVRRAELIRKANEIERVADQHEKRYSELQLLVRSLEDESNEVRIRITSAQRREELVGDARGRIEASAKLLQSQSKDARTDAENIATELGADFDAVMKTLNEQETPAFEEAAGKYREAASQAMQARGEVASSAPAVAAMAQHAAANLHLSQADLLQSMLLLAQDLSGQLQAPRFAEAADTIQQHLKEASSQAADLYETAGNTYARLNLGPGNSLQDLSSRFQAFAGQLRGEKPAPAPGEQQAAPPSGENGAPAPQPPAGSDTESPPPPPAPDTTPGADQPPASPDGSGAETPDTPKAPDTPPDAG